MDSISSKQKVRNFINIEPLQANDRKLWEGDCRLIVLCHLLKYYNIIEISPKDIIGFQAAIGFSLSKICIDNISLISINGRNLVCENEFCKKRNIELEEKVFEEGISIDKWFDIICHNIDNGDPVIINVDRFYLTYLNIERAHFGYHVILIIGYDRVNRVFNIIDALSDKVHAVRDDTIFFAMKSNIIYAAPKRKWFTIKYTGREKYLLTMQDFLESLKKQSQIILNNSLKDMKFIYSFLKSINRKDLRQETKKKYIKYQILFWISTIKNQDGTGTLYRKTYYTFIKQYSEYYDISFLYQHINKLIEKEIKAWNCIGSDNIEINTLKLAKKFKKNLRKIYRLERKIFISLKKDLKSIDMNTENLSSNNIK